MRPTPRISPALRAAMGGALGEAHVEPRRDEPARLAGRALCAAVARSAPRRFEHAQPCAPSSTASWPSGRSPASTPFPCRWRNSCPRALRSPFVMDFVDFNSVKYADYARSGTPAEPGDAPLGSDEHVRAAKRRPPRARTSSLFVSEAEAALFRSGGRPVAGRRSGRCRTASTSTISIPTPASRRSPPRAGPADRLHRPDGLPPQYRGGDALRARRCCRRSGPRGRTLDFAIVGRNPPLAGPARSGRSPA